MRGLSKYFSYCFLEDTQENEYQIKLWEYKASNLTIDQIDKALAYDIPMSTIFFDRERQSEVKDFLNYHFSKYSGEPEDFFDAVDDLYVCGRQVTNRNVQELKSDFPNGLKWIKKKREELKNKPYFLNEEDSLPPLYQFTSSKEESHPYDIVLKDYKKKEDGSLELIVPDNYVLSTYFLGKLYGNKNPAFNHHAFLDYHYNQCDEELKPTFLKWTENMWLDRIKSDEKNKRIQKINEDIEDWFKSKREKIKLEQQKILKVKKFLPNLNPFRRKFFTYSDSAKDFLGGVIIISLWGKEEKGRSYLTEHYEKQTDKELFLECIEDLTKTGSAELTNKDLYEWLNSPEYVNNIKGQLLTLKSTIPNILYDWIAEKRKEIEFNNNTGTEKFLQALKRVEYSGESKGRESIGFVKDASRPDDVDENIRPLYNEFVSEVWNQDPHKQRSILILLKRLFNDLNNARNEVNKCYKEFGFAAISMLELKYSMIEFVGFDKQEGYYENVVWGLRFAWGGKASYAWKAIEHLSAVLDVPLPEEKKSDLKPINNNITETPTLSAKEIDNRIYCELNPSTIRDYVMQLAQKEVLTELEVESFLAANFRGFPRATRLRLFDFGLDKIKVGCLMHFFYKLYYKAKSSHKADKADIWCQMLMENFSLLKNYDDPKTVAKVWSKEPSYYLFKE